MTGARPTVRRRRLAAVLLALREEAGKTPEEAAERIGCHRTKISRIENAHLGISLGELRDLLAFYGVEDADYVEQLVGLARRGREPGWLQRLGTALPSYADYVGYEQSANYIRSYEPLLVTGLLQTPDYARALLEGSNAILSRQRMDELVGVRMERQRVLEDDKHPRLCVIEGEAALLTCVGGSKVMRAQLDHLLTLAEHPNVELQVVPHSAGAHAGFMGAFVLFGFPTPAFSDVVCVEHYTGTLYLETPEEIETYTLTFDSLRSTALAPAESRDLITRLKTTFD
ncbi:helix-turn-helix domain-containing protein [Streptomyces sp. MAR4 CNX-425]|uniref:helix-turn-helix domain-containing protein n=1 Tax=Streptomyces sp. MAR4 CNX-425 TaxID=3406343 RepID=UPI003B4FFC7D